MSRRHGVAGLSAAHQAQAALASGDWPAAARHLSHLALEQGGLADVAAAVRRSTYLRDHLIIPPTLGDQLVTIRTTG